MSLWCFGFEREMRLNQRAAKKSGATFQEGILYSGPPELRSQLFVCLSLPNCLNKYL